MTTIEIDRMRVCPLLLRVFVRDHGHNDPRNYARGSKPSNELQMYTWLNATLEELAQLVQQVNPNAKQKGTFLDFSIVSPDPRSSAFKMREFGTVCSGVAGCEDKITLQDRNFAIGDFLDVAISPPPLFNPRRGDNRMARGGKRPSPPRKWQRAYP